MDTVRNMMNDLNRVSDLTQLNVQKKKNYFAFVETAV